MGVLLSPLLRVPPKLPHRKYFRRGPRPFPPAGPHGFRGHLTRLTLCVAIAIPSVRRDAIGAARSNRWTFGSGTRASEDGASAAPPCYAACNAPASRSDGALLAHCTSALGTHTVAAALKRASPCERLVSGSTPNEITSCQAASRSEFSLNRFQKGDGARGDTSNECALAAAHKKSAARQAPRGDVMERMKGIEPSTAAWEAAVLPLNYIRINGVTVAA